MKHKLLSSITATAILIAQVVTLGVPTAARAVSNFTYDTKVTYRIEDSETAAVTEQYNITNNTARQYLTELKLSTPAAELTGLKVAYSDGTNVPATVAPKHTTRGDIGFDYAEITIDFPRQTYGLNRQWAFTVTYKAKGLIDSKGGGKTVYVPSIEAGDPGDSYKVTVDVPIEFGSPHFAGAKSASGGIMGGRQFYEFDKADLVSHSLALVFGDSSVYKLNFNYPLVNDTPLPRTVTLALPPDMTSQKSYINSLSPAPTNTRLDADGNILADYSLKAHEIVTVQTDVNVAVKYLEYDITKSGKRSEIPQYLVDQYTKPGQYWQTTGAVAQQAQSLIEPDAPVINNVKAIYEFVINKLSYNQDKISFNIRQGADKALANPNNAVCLEYADLMIAMLRSAGIPARMPIGYAYTGNLKATASVADSLHAWVEAYVPGIGWMSFDPTWGEKFDEFGKSDLDHVAFAVWGNDDAKPVAVALGNTDENYQYEKTDLSYITEVAKEASAATVKVHRWVILPFVAFDQIQAIAPGQTATDTNTVTVGNRALQLGSLAPTQKFSLNVFTSGGSWQSSEPVVFGRTESGTALVLASSNVAVDRRPMFGLLAVLLIVSALIGVLRWRNRRTGEYTPPVPISVSPMEPPHEV